MTSPTQTDNNKENEIKQQQPPQQQQQQEININKLPNVLLSKIIGYSINSGVNSIGFNNNNEESGNLDQDNKDQKVSLLLTNYYNVSNVCKTWRTFTSNNFLMLDLNPFVIYKLKYQFFNNNNINNSISNNNNDKIKECSDFNIHTFFKVLSKFKSVERVHLSNFNFISSNSNSSSSSSSSATTTTSLNNSPIINTSKILSTSSIIANRLSTKAALLLTRDNVDEQDHFKTLLDLKSFYSSSLSNFTPSTVSPRSTTSPTGTIGAGTTSMLFEELQNNNNYNIRNERFFSSTSALDEYRLNQILYENSICNIDRLDIECCSNFKSIEFVNYFLNSKYIQTISINQCLLRDWDCSVLFFTIKNSESMRYIDLSKNRIQEEGAKTISMVLKEEQCKLESLILDDNRIGTIGLQSISKSLYDNVNSKLSTLSLKNNQINLDGALSLLQTLHTNRSLTFIDLSDNNFSSNELLKHYCMIYLMSVDQKLVLSPNVQLKVNETIFNKIDDTSNGNNIVDGNLYQQTTTTTTTTTTTNTTNSYRKRNFQRFSMNDFENCN